MKIKIEYLKWLDNKPVITEFEGTTEEFEYIMSRVKRKIYTFYRKAKYSNMIENENNKERGHPLFNENGKP